MKFPKFVKYQCVVHFLLFCMELWQYEDFKIMNLMIFYFFSEESYTGDLFGKKICHVLLILIWTGSNVPLVIEACIFIAAVLTFCGSFLKKFLFSHILCHSVKFSMKLTVTLLQFHKINLLQRFYWLMLLSSALCREDNQWNWI